MSDASHRWPTLQITDARFIPTDHSGQNDAERERILEKARQAGYDSGFAAGEQAAQDQMADRLQHLDSSIQQAREQLSHWQAAYCQMFGAQAHALLNELGAAQIELKEDFYTELLLEVAQQLDMQPEALLVEVAPDLIHSQEPPAAVRIESTLAPGEIRVSSGPKVARIDLTEQVRQALNVALAEPDEALGASEARSDDG
ncbi:MAG: hypothetical protein ACR2PZ_04680 [Pseudomonadales bacterium]